MTAKRQFSDENLAAIQGSKGLRIRAGTGQHRFIGIWVVVVRGRVFVRSWSVKPNGWYRTFLKEPRGASFETLEVTIQYVSMQCGSTGGTSFSLLEFQVLTTPTNSSSEVAYQIPIRVPASLVGVVNTGLPVTIYAGANSGARALIDLVPAPKANTTQCTVSLSYARD